jgi:predicted nucleic acid-binding protein
VIVLDTNVVSEPLRARPDPGVLRWLGRHPDGLITSVTVGELLTGVRMLPSGRRRTELLDAVEAALEARSGRILAYHEHAARHYAEVRELRRSDGRGITTEDGMIAAVCLHHGARLATRNVRDFDGLGIDVVDPWDAS